MIMIYEKSRDMRFVYIIEKEKYKEKDIIQLSSLFIETIHVNAV